MQPLFVDALGSFFAYFGVAIALMVLFLSIYVAVTPYPEIRLIREGNLAAAVSLAGALLGFVLPISNAIAHSETLIGLAVWGCVAGIVQLLAYFVARLTFPKMCSDIPAGKLAPALFLAALSVSIGLINSACMVY